MRRTLSVLACVLLLAGCYPEIKTPVYDKEKAHSIFIECMSSVKENPKQTHYADQDEVIAECRYTAFALSRLDQ